MSDRKDLGSQLEGLFSDISDIALELEAQKEEAVFGPTEAEIGEGEREVPPTSHLVREATLREERRRLLQIGLCLLLIIVIIIVGMAVGLWLLGHAPVR